MAIDPSISLQVKQPEGVDITKWGQLANLGMQNRVMQEQIATSQAQRPGIVADTEIKRKAAAFKKWQTDNSSKFVREDGSIDTAAFVSDASKAGFFTEAQGVATTDLDNAGKRIANAKDDVARAEAENTFRTKLDTYASEVLKHLPENQRMQALEKWAKGVDQMKPGEGKRLVDTFATVDPKTNLPTVNMDRINATRTATMTPQQQEEIRSSQILDLTSPEARDPKSNVSKVKQDQFLAANSQYDPVRIRQMSAAEIQGLEQGAGAGTIQMTESGQRLTASERVGVAESLSTLIAQQNSINRGANAARDLMTSAAGKTFIGEKANAIIQKYAKVNPKIKMLADSVQAYEQATGRKLDDSVTIEGLEEVLRSGASDLTPKIKTRRSATSGGKLELDVQPETSAETSPTGTPQRKAPAAAIDFLKKNPQFKEQFKAKYGYLPEGM